MNKQFMTLVLSFVLSISLFAQKDSTIYQEEYLTQDKCEKALKYYLISLDYENTGVVESAITNIMKVKCHHPGIDYSKMIDKLRMLVEHGETKDIRAMAFICAKYLALKENSASFARMNKNETSELISILVGK